MELGYYWAHRVKDDKWLIVQVVPRLPGHLMCEGYRWPRISFDAFEGPLERGAESLDAERWKRATAAREELHDIEREQMQQRIIALQAERNELAARLARIKEHIGPVLRQLDMEEHRDIMQQPTVGQFYRHTTGALARYGGMEDGWHLLRFVDGRTVRVAPPAFVHDWAPTDDRWTDDDLDELD